MNSARELLQFNFNSSAFARRALQPTQILQQTLDTLEDITQRHGDTEHEPANREDLRQIYRLFINAHRTRRLRAEFDLLRRTRQLAWALTYSEDGLPRIVDTSQLNDALRLIENFPAAAHCSVFSMPCCKHGIHRMQGSYVRLLEDILPITRGVEHLFRS